MLFRFWLISYLADVFLFVLMWVSGGVVEDVLESVVWGLFKISLYCLMEFVSVLSLLCRLVCCNFYFLCLRSLDLFFDVCDCLLIFYL